MLPRTGQTIDKQNDHEILSKMGKIKEIKAPKGKQRAKKKVAMIVRFPKKIK